MPHENNALRHSIARLHTSGLIARSIEASCKGEEGQIRGLVETVGFIHDVIREEAKIVGSRENVVLGGLSQGCGFVGMSGWLPFREGLEGVLHAGTEEEGEGEGVFLRDEDEEVVSVQVQAVNFVRDNLDLPVTLVEDGEHGCLGRKCLWSMGWGMRRWVLGLGRRLWGH